jgi:hypothetical protein
MAMRVRRYFICTRNFISRRVGVNSVKRTKEWGKGGTVIARTISASANRRLLFTHLQEG